jgi:hypothetical protein
MRRLRVTPSDLTTTTDVAERYGISPGAVLAAIHAGRIPAKRIGSGRGIWVLRMSDAEQVWSYLLPVGR